MEYSSKRETWFFGTACCVVCYMLLTTVLDVETKWLQRGGLIEDAFVFAGMLVAAALLFTVAQIVLAAARRVARVGRR